MLNFSLTCFGVGDGMPCGDRNHAAFLYRLGKTALLVDCGDPISRSYKAAGLSYDLIDRIFISHLHADHIGGFFMLLQGCWLERRKKALPVHLPADGIEPVRQMMKVGCLFDELLPFRLSLDPLRPRQPVSQGRVRVTPHPTSHLRSFRDAYQAKYPGEYAAYAFVIEAGGFRIGHSADLGAVSDLAPLVAQPLDVLVCELSHFKAEELFDFLKGRAIKHVVFTHLGRPYWEKLGTTRKRAARKLANSRLSFPRDQETIKL
jgi:ribonuclease Z